MFRVVIAMIIASVATAGGQILFRRGMQQIGSLEVYAPGALISYFRRAMMNGYVIGGTILNVVFYLLLIATLSWTDVTVALPFTALEYAFSAVLAITFLHEVVPPVRWVAIMLVLLGVVLVTMSGEATMHRS